MEKPLVAVWMLTYNHERFIAQALDSVLMQKTKFPYKIYLGEDCSTDGTRNICIAYSERYPDKIELFLNATNDVKKNAYTIWGACFDSGAKYIALLEGDDYWTDKQKLQIQVAFLEANPEYGSCCHRYKVLDQVHQAWHGDGLDDLFANGETGIELDLEKVLRRFIVHTPTFVFRKDLFHLADTRKYPHFRDSHLFFLLLRAAKGYCFAFDGATYRWHGAGMHTGNDPLSRQRIALAVYRELLQEGENAALERLLSITLSSIISIKASTIPWPMVDQEVLKSLWQLWRLTKSPIIVAMNCAKLLCYPALRLFGQDPLSRLQHHVDS